MAFSRVMAMEDLWNGEMQSIKREGVAILLVKVKDQVYAYEDRCPHQGVALSEGNLEYEKLTCCAHYWQYHIGTGCGINPKNTRLKSFPVCIKEGDIWVDVSGENNDARK